jgi:hypothetical protein
MDSRTQSDLTRDGEVNLAQTDLIRTKSFLKKENLSNISTTLNKSQLKRKKLRVRFEMNKNEIINIASYKHFNAENVFREPNHKKKILCNCILF